MDEDGDSSDDNILGCFRSGCCVRQFVCVLSLGSPSSPMRISHSYYPGKEWSLRQAETWCPLTLSLWQHLPLAALCHQQRSWALVPGTW